jgi:hypothetical protein
MAAAIASADATSAGEVADNRVRIQVERVCIGADEGAAEDAGRPMRNVIALEVLEQRQLDLRLFGDRGQSNLLLFTVPAQSGAKTLVHAHTSARGTKLRTQCRDGKC